MKLSVAHPAVPSFATIELMPAMAPGNSDGIVVCIRTFTASKGHRPTSAMASAVALAAR